MAFGVLNIQGTISTGGTTLYTPSTGYNGFVRNIKFNNTDGVSFLLSFYKVTTLGTFLLYQVQLDAGDFIDDDSAYDVLEGDSLYAECDVDNTTFVINGNEIPNIVEVIT